MNITFFFGTLLHATQYIIQEGSEYSFKKAKIRFSIDVNFQQEEEVLGTTDSLSRPQWENGFDVEIENQKQAISTSTESFKDRHCKSLFHSDNLHGVPVQHHGGGSPPDRCLWPVVRDLYCWCFKVSTSCRTDLSFFC